MKSINMIDGMSLDEMLEIAKWDGSNVSVTAEDKSFKVINVNRVAIHNLAKKHRVQSEQEFISLVNSIMISGQLQPIILYRDKAVDGRHRISALKKLGIEWVKYIELPNNWSLKQVEEAVIGTDNGRNDSSLQKAAKAYIDFYENGHDKGEAAEYAIKHGTTPGSMSKIGKFAEYYGIERVKEAYNHGKVKVNEQFKSTISALYKLALEASKSGDNDGDEVVVLNSKIVNADADKIISTARKMEDDDLYYLAGVFNKMVKQRMGDR